MPVHCRKVSVRSSGAQWSLDALVSFPEGGEPIPCFFSVMSAWCVFQAPSSEEGEKLLAEVKTALGPPASPPQVVKGGSCGGEEDDGEFPFTGAMLSVTWEFPREGREAFIARIGELFASGGAKAAG